MDDRKGPSDLYPVACGWCGGAVCDAEGWTLHGYALCRILEYIGDPPCLVTVKPDVYEWLTEAAR